MSSPAEAPIVRLEAAPSLLSGYLRGLVLPKPRFRRGAPLPPVRVVRRGLALAPAHLAAYRAACARWPGHAVPLEYPLSLLFPYHLELFARPELPFRFPKLLGLRNHVVQRRPLALADRLDLEAVLEEARVLPKGLELTVRTTLSAGAERPWESVHLYLLRGAFGGSDEPRPDPVPALPAETDELRFAAPPAGGREFARLTGDWNGLHWSRSWARALGFRRDFAHTQRIVSACLSRLPAPGEGAVRLDVSFKGPVYYGSPLALRTADAAGARLFELFCGDEPRPAFRGRLAPARDGEPLP